MTLIEAMQVLKSHNEWRRDETGEIPMVNPQKIGQAIDVVLEKLEKLIMEPNGKE